jgi:hypothetical protein
MSAPQTRPPAILDNESILEAYDLSFDPADKRNGSLYLCTPRGSALTRPDAWIAGLREAGLWSPEPPRQVPDEQRQAYRDGLVFVAAVAYAAGPEHVLLARFDHPKFPSDSERWEAWIDHCDVRHARLE